MDQKSKISKKRILPLHLFLAFAGIGFMTFFLLGSRINFLFFKAQEDQISAKVIDNISKNQYNSVDKDILYTEKIHYYPYEPIEIFVKLNQESSSNMGLVLVVLDDKGNPTKNIFNEDCVLLSFSTNHQLYHLVWYPKNTSYHGVLKFEVRASSSLFEQKSLLKKSIYVSLDQGAYSLPHSYTFLGMDSKEADATRRILSIKGKEATKSDLVNWFSLYNNDAVVMPVGITKTFDFDPNKPFPIWDIDKLNENLALAKSFSSYKIKSAVWIQALEIDGAFKPELEYTESIRSNIEYTNSSWISISDQKRKNHLKKILEDLSLNKDIFFIGFTKALFYQNFHNDLQKKFDQLFPSLLPVDRRSFEQWKQYQIVQYFREILLNNKKDKPIFFIFEGKELLVNPQILDMAFSVGADFIMLDLDVPLEFLSTELKLIKKNTSFEKFHDKIVLSYQINHNNSFSKNISSLENWVSENLKLLADEHINSLRIQDFYRALFGNRGAYPAYQWMLMIGDLISKWKEKQFIFPVEHSIVADKKTISDHISLNVELYNRSSDTIKDYQMELLSLVSVPNINILIKLPIINSKEILRTNITLSNVKFERGALKKKTHFLGLLTKYSSKEFQNLQQVHMISFIDPDVTENVSLEIDDNFNSQIKLVDISRNQTDFQKEETNIIPNISSQSSVVSSQTNTEPFSNKAPETKPVQVKKVDEKEIEKSKEEDIDKEADKKVDKKKVPLWKRNRQKNKEKE
ncbi:MAG: hypothetical protein ACRCTJ_03545 [Brevinema sp.]